MLMADVMDSYLFLADVHFPNIVGKSTDIPLVVWPDARGRWLARAKPGRQDRSSAQQAKAMRNL